MKAAGFIVALIVGSLALASCEKKAADSMNFRSAIVGYWKEEKVEWEKNIPSINITNSGVETGKNDIQFKGNGTVTKFYDEPHWFSYSVRDSLIYMEEFGNANAYRIIVLNSTALVLDFVKENVDWDKDGVPENLYRRFYYRRVRN
ncbi:MAG: hypothetical protein J7599_15435 [Niabella sp.]|nr:hypothetical protein [Niabella sp.]